MQDTTQTRNSLLAPNFHLQAGKYRIEKTLASGGFGNTYEVTHVMFEKRFALKEFFIKGVAERMDDSVTVSVPVTDNKGLFESQKKKFHREARLLSQLKNRHIVQVHDLFEENGTAYYVMDYIEGESLSAYMRRTQKPMPEHEVITILMQLVDALRDVHAKNIWHMDIKPGNIMRTANGNIVLIDFGASKQISQEDGHTITTTSLSYTPGYAPPEQIEQNKRMIGAWTDMYALGATLYNLLTNEKPPTFVELGDDSAFHFPSGVSEEMQHLVKWMMQPMVKQRPQNIETVGQYINEKILDNNIADTDRVVDPVIEENTVVERSTQEPQIAKEEFVEEGQDTKGGKNNYVLFSILASVALFLLFTILSVRECSNRESTEIISPDTTAVEEVVVDSSVVSDEIVSSETPAATRQQTSTPAPRQTTTTTPSRPTQTTTTAPARPSTQAPSRTTPTTTRPTTTTTPRPNTTTPAATPRQGGTNPSSTGSTTSQMGNRSTGAPTGGSDAGGGNGNGGGKQDPKKDGDGNRGNVK